MATVLLITRGTSGDVHPFLAIGSALKMRGHQVIFLTHCYYADVVKHAGLEFIALDTPEEFEQFIADGSLLNTPRGVLAFFQKHLLPFTRNEYDMLQHLGRQRDVVMVVRHMSSIAAKLVAEKLHYPLVGVFAAPSQLAALPLLAKACESLMAREINDIRATYGLSGVIDWNDWLKYPSKSIALWPEWFAPLDAMRFSKVVSTGFILYNEGETESLPEEVQEILSPGELPVLITGGTGIFSGPRFYAVSIEACELANRRAIVTTPHEHLLPNSMPHDISWFRYVLFANLLPHISTIIHHGGIGTIARASVAGIPQLVLPFGGDRPDNASHLQRLGVAVSVLPFQWDAHYIAQQLNWIASSSNLHQQCREVAQRICASSSELTACEIIEEAV